MDDEKEKERKAILAKLQMLEKTMKLHEWSSFGQGEAGELEETETEVDSEAPGSKDEQTRGE